MRGVWAGARLQLTFFRHQPDLLFPAVAGPVFVLIFLMVLRQAGRADLGGYAAVAPMLITLWGFALLHGGAIIQRERGAETLELHLAAPTTFASVVLGRVAAVTVVGSLSTVEIWLVARYLLGARISVHHPGVLTATMTATALAIAATALLMAGLFVLARSAITFSNAATYPFYVLGGVLVPVALLPAWTHPVSRVVFLSWSADLLRAALAPQPVPDAAGRLAVVTLLGIGEFLLAAVLMRRILGRLRMTGEVGLR
jgi:ABC-2 type transport system permease protein